ncbi:ABC transporter permease subunit [Rheinheimera sp. UJ51]|uniref:ABC transporter permease n=1 Tax=Rheinheimera sp. UJ51 TaxID=2892446 RepID=UPI001E610D9E|nr:ABC transporter permease subunit [Rheinheimera sp. UJ51]MCC5451201.1 ABC transporter permease subunit [Rheinheimera sp. UJ51]
MKLGQSLYDWGIRVAPWLLFALLVLPVLGGLIGVLLPAFGWLPTLGSQQVNLLAWQQLWQQPGLPQMVTLSVTSGVLSSLLALLVCLLLLGCFYGSRGMMLLQRIFSPLLAIPHATAAIAIAFLLTPSGFFSRVFALLTGWQTPPDWLLPNDAAGVSIMLALFLKELPFLMIMSLAALANSTVLTQFQLAQSMGYQRLTAFCKVVLPQLYPKLRLPIYAVLAYGCANVEIAQIVGPSGPPTLAVAIVQWFNDVDLHRRFMASAGAVLQLAVVLSVLLAWWCAERLLAWGLGRLLSNGRRSYADVFWQRLSRLILGLVGLTLVLAMGGLILWSLAGYWSYPDLVPDTLQLSHWLTALPFIRLPLLNAVVVAFAASGLALLLTLATLEAEQVRQKPLSWLSQSIIYLPLLVPAIAFLFGVVWLQEQLGIAPGMGTVIASHSLFVLPYVFLALAGNYRLLDPRWANVAASLGLSPGAVFVRVKLPLLFKPILLALALGLAVSFGQYLPTLLTGAGRVATLTTEAVALANGGSRRLVAVYALLQMLLPALAFLLAYWCSKLFFQPGTKTQSNASVAVK